MRKILRMLHSYVSHVTEAVVLEEARRVKLSCALLERQLDYFVRIPREGDQHSFAELSQNPRQRNF